MKKLVLIFCLCMPAMVVAQGYEFEFNTLLRNPEVTPPEVAALLQRWEAAEPESVAVKVAYFNFLLQQGMREEVVTEAEPPADGSPSLELTDEETGEVAGYMYSKVIVVDSLIEQAIGYLDQALAQAPMRLDIYFGRATACGRTGHFRQQAETIVRLLDVYEQSPEGWYFRQQLVTDPMDEVIQGVTQTYFEMMYNAAAPDTESMRVMANAMLQVFPGHAMSYSNLGTSYILQEDLEPALAAFEQGHALAPADLVITLNLAYAHMQMDHVEEARALYQQVARTEEVQYAAQAEYWLQQLEQSSIERE